MKKLVDVRTVKEIVEILTQNFLLSRWSLLGKNQTNYNQLTKHGLNCIIAFCIAVEVEKSGKKIIWERFPWIALKRAIQKTVNGDIRDDHIDQICERAKINREEFDKIFEKKYINVNKEILDRLLKVSEDWLETRIYRAATRLATLIEIVEISPNSPEEQEVRDSIVKFNDIPGFLRMAFKGSPEYSLFEDVSKLRFCIRWAKKFTTCDCDVLGHMFETGVLAWLMSLAKNPEDEKTATHFFWCGTFHDLPERWTGDMDSRIKDEIKDLRKGTEIFELEMLEEKVYSKLPKYMEDAVKTVMMEDKKNEDIKEQLKYADNLSAFFECYRNIMRGTRDYYFKEVIHRQIYLCDKLPGEFQKLVEEIYKEIG